MTRLCFIDIQAHNKDERGLDIEPVALDMGVEKAVPHKGIEEAVPHKDIEEAVPRRVNPSEHCLYASANKDQCCAAGNNLAADQPW